MNSNSTMIGSLARAGAAIAALGLSTLLLINVLPQFASAQNAPSAQDSSAQTQAVEIKRADFGSWSYQAIRDASGAHAGVYVPIHYNYDSIQALRTYAANNQLLASKIAAANKGEKTQVYITFRNYIAPDQFRTWAKIMGLHVEQSELRITQTDGTAGTFILDKQATDADPLLQASIDQELAVLQKGPGVQTLQGVFFTRATVDAARLPNIAADPSVFLADVTPNVVRNELTYAGLAKDGELNIEVIPPTPFFMLEQFGLGNFQK